MSYEKKDNKAQAETDEITRIELDAPEAPEAPAAPAVAPHEHHEHHSPEELRTKRHEGVLDAHRAFNAELDRLLPIASDHKQRALEHAHTAAEHAHHAIDAEK